MREKNIRYRGKNIVVMFNPDRCIHVAECLRGLPEVFDNSRSPWISPDAAPPDLVAEVVCKCPTGSLHYFRTDGGPEELPCETNRVIVTEDGPLYALGNIEIVSPDGALVVKDTRIGLCRCGASRHMPVCDGRHFAADFVDTGTLAERGETLAVQPAPGAALRIVLAPNGPLLVTGTFTLESEAEGRTIALNRASLCRCGASKIKPYCDGSHTRAGFKAE
jgi:CDGSH-type Zn-finger protein/uncharacterized Fe-S cluster protein YjdI